MGGLPSRRAVRRTRSRDGARGRRGLSHGGVTAAHRGGSPVVSTVSAASREPPRRSRVVLGGVPPARQSALTPLAPRVTSPRDRARATGVMRMRADAQAPTIRLADYRAAGLPRRQRRADLRARPGGDPGARRASPSAATRARRRAGRSTCASTAASLRLVSAAIDGAPVPQNALAVDDEGLTVAADARAATPSSGRPRPRSPPRPTPRSRGSTCRAACTAPSARRRASARSPTSPTAPT